MRDPNYQDWTLGTFGTTFIVYYLRDFFLGPMVSDILSLDRQLFNTFHRVGIELCEGLFTLASFVFRFSLMTFHLRLDQPSRFYGT